MISVKRLGKKYSTRLIISDVNLTLENGAYTSILGTSGSGKTTLLNLFSLLDLEYSGKIDSPFDLFNTSALFQESLLLDWLNLFENAVLPQKIIKNLDKKYLKKLFIEVGLENFLDYHPKELSGGMKRRGALVRALGTKPDFVTLDEPTTGLDFINRERIYTLFLEELIKKKKTVIMATHNIEEAVLLSNRILILGNSPATICHDVNIDLPYPRIKNLDFLNKVNEIEILIASING